MAALAKQSLMYYGSFGITAFLCGTVFVDRFPSLIYQFLMSLQVKSQTSSDEAQLCERESEGGKHQIVDIPRRHEVR